MSRQGGFETRPYMGSVAFLVGGLACGQPVFE